MQMSLQARDTLPLPPYLGRVVVGVAESNSPVAKVGRYYKQIAGLVDVGGQGLAECGFPAGPAQLLSAGVLCFGCLAVSTLLRSGRLESSCMQGWHADMTVRSQPDRIMISCHCRLVVYAGQPAAGICSVSSASSRCMLSRSSASYLSGARAPTMMGTNVNSRPLHGPAWCTI